MISIKDGTIKKNNVKTVVGIDLGKEYAQISFFKSGEAEPETVSAVTGTEMYNIPTVLAKRKKVGQWFYGRDALKRSSDDVIPVDDLLNKAIRGEDVMVEDEAYDPVALLILFIKRSLGLLNMRISAKEIDAYMFTLDELSQRAVEVLGKIAAALDIKNENVTYASHVECFYSYMIHQPEELWKYQVMVYEYNDILKSMLFECSHNTVPEVVFIHSTAHENIKRIDWSSEEDAKQAQQTALDEDFNVVCEEELRDTDVTTIYLIGEGFKESWAKESLKTLCRNRRVFQGNNLFSKGACYAMMDRLSPSEISKNHVYLGEDKIKANIGMNVLRRGEESYFAILDAGRSWYEINEDFEIILDEGNELSFVITSLTGGHVTEKTVVLEGLPKRPRGTTRLSIHIEMEDVNNMEIQIEDKGFGEIIKSCGSAWTHVLSLD